jgi:hypothetical protein
MKENLKYMLIEPFTDDGDWAGYTLGVLIWILTIAIVGLLLWLSVWLVDSSFLPIKERQGTITNKYEGMILRNNYHHTSYKAEVTIDGIEFDVCLSQDYWDTIEVGQKLCCRYTNGRIMKSLYIKSFCEEQK